MTYSFESKSLTATPTMKISSIQNSLHEHLQCYPTQTLVIACSGGVDSIVLLHEIANLANTNLANATPSNTHKISNKIIVCYVDHGLSDNAVNWHNFVKAQCLQLGLPFIGKKVTLDKSLNQSLEAQARNARYSALKEVASTNGVVITAHHQDDQVETFLLALKRGAGIKGLSAMAVHSTLLTTGGELPLVRPLLTIARKTIEERAKALALDWVEDESNLDQQFDRNFLRQTVVPLLSQRWSSIVRTINRSSEHCREGQLLLDELAAEDMNNCQHDDKSLSVEPLRQLSQGRFNNLIRYFLAQSYCLMPSTEQLAQLRLQLNANDDKNPAVKFGEYYLRRYKDVLYLTADFADISGWQTKVSLNEQETLIELPNCLGKLSFLKTSVIDDQESSQFLAMPSIGEQVSIRFFHDNPRCLPDYRNHSRSLKKVLQELNIPPWQRKRISFLYYGEVMVAAIGFFVCQEFLPTINEPCLKITWTH